MKRFISLFLLVVMCLGAFGVFGCAPKSGAGETDIDVPEEGYDGSAVTIKFYHTMSEALRKVLDTHIAEFNKLYPNIKVEHEQVGGYDDVRDQISTEITVGGQPNIAYCYPDHVALYNISKATACLDNLIDSKIVVKRADGTEETLGLTDEQKADFIPGYYNEGKSYGDDKMYSLPYSKSTEVLYYNETFFNEHGLKAPKTWDELEALCRKIKEIDPKCIPLGYDSEANWFITLCEQHQSPYTSATGEHFLFDNETNHNFILKLRKWYQEGLLTTQAIYGGYTSGLFVAEKDKIRSYMSIGSSAGAKHQRPAKDADGKYPFSVGIASIPQIDVEHPKVISQGPSLCIFRKDNVQEVIASWLFVKFLTTNVELQAEFSMASGYVPVIKSVGDNKTYKEKFLDKADGGEYVAALSAKACLAQADAYYTSPAFNGSSTARDQVGALLQKCLIAPADGNETQMVQKAFAEAVEECRYQTS